MTTQGKKIYKNYYDILGLDFRCSEGDVIRSFRQLAKKHHPDITGVREFFDFNEIVKAYKILSQPSLRLLYDKKIGIAPKKVLANKSSQKPALKKESNGAFSGNKSNFSGETGKIHRVYLDKTRLEFAFQMKDLIKGGLLRKKFLKKSFRLTNERNFDVSVRLSSFENSFLIVLAVDLPIRRRCPQCSGDPIMSSICSVCNGRGQTTEMRTTQIFIPPLTSSGTILNFDLRKLQPGGLAYFRLKSLRVRVLVKR